MSVYIFHAHSSDDIVSTAPLLSFCERLKLIYTVYKLIEVSIYVELTKLDSIPCMAHL